MKVLIVTAMYPKPENSAFGSFIRTQVESLRRAGVEVELLLLQGRPRKWSYLKGIFQLHERLAKGSFDLVHAHYGLAGMVGRTEWKVPVVVTFHGDDLLGTVNTRGKQTLLSPLIVAAGLRWRVLWTRSSSRARKWRANSRARRIGTTPMQKLLCAEYLE